MKEPGELAYEAWVKAYGGTSIPWEKLGDDERDEWAAVESTIRADEAAKVRAATIDECAELVDFPSDATATTEPSDYVKSRRDAAAAIRAKIGAEHGN
jgi:hypothetical protein